MSIYLDGVVVNFMKVFLKQECQNTYTNVPTGRCWY